MLYTFKSKSSANLIMLQPNGERMLEIIGKQAGAKGIILPEQMPAAIAALQAALDQEVAALHVAVKNAQASGEPPPRLEAVSLRQRATPFIDMLQRCHKAGQEIVWGV